MLSFESRRAVETAELIRRNEGEPIVAPALREVPLDRNEEAFRFAERLIAGDFDMVILLTGVGTRQLIKALSSRYPVERITEALSRVTLVARGPKPSAALRELGLCADIIAPEPNTWRELMSKIEGRPERRIAIQEYGRPNEDLSKALQEMGAEVTRVLVYTYDLPEDLEPLRGAVTRLAQQDIEVTLFTTAQQAVHLMQIAREMNFEEAVMKGLRRSVIASIGPTTTEMLAEYGLTPDVTPEHPKLGILVKEAADKAPEILWNKKA